MGTIYKYDNRNMVEFNNKTRASYSVKRYGALLEMVTQQSLELDKKIWNPYKIDGLVTHIYYWDQKNKEIKDILIDTEELEKVRDYYWQLNCNGYPVSRTKGQKIYLYRLIMNCYDMEVVIDHINRNPLINIKSNLRIVTVSINNRNKTTADRCKEIPFVGVHFNKKNKGENKKKYRMRINDMNGHIIDECFYSLEEAKERRIFYEQQFGYLRRFND